MALSAQAGPLVTFVNPGFDYNPDVGPNVRHKGDLFADPRTNLAYSPGNPSTSLVFGWPTVGAVPIIDQIPSTLSATNIASTGAITSNKVTLVASSGAGITVGASVFNPASNQTVTGLWGIDVCAARTATGTFTNGSASIGCTNNNILGVKNGDALTLTTSGTLPTPFALLTTNYVVAIQTGSFPASGAAAKLLLALAPGGAPIAATSAGSGTQTLNFIVPSTQSPNQSPILFGQANNPTGPVASWNPAFAISRAIVITTTADDTAGFYTVNGYDIYGYPMTQTVAGVSSTTVTTTKAFKYISSVVTSGTINSTTASVGTTDVIGLPLRTDDFAYLSVWWGATAQTLLTSDAGPGLVPADIAVPSATTGDVRGTFLLPTSASNGTRRLSVFWTPLPANLTTTAGILGQTQF
jgi:hypothetical protein